MCLTRDCLIDKIYEFSMKQVKCENVSYDLQFLSCSHNLSNSERQKVIRKHKSSGQKRAILEKRRGDYRNLEPAEKKICVDRRKDNYKSMDHCEKKSLLDTKNEKYKSMSGTDNKVFSANTC